MGGVNCLAKYKEVKGSLQEGDIILVTSKKPLAKIIQKIDKCDYHHSGLIVFKDNRILVLNAHPGGVRIELMSVAIKRHKWEDFKIIRPLFKTDTIKSAVSSAIEKAEEWVKYDMALVFRVLFYTTLNIDFKWMSNDKKQICSEFTQYYGLMLGSEAYKQTKRPFFTPEDHIRLLDPSEFKIV